VGTSKVAPPSRWGCEEAWALLIAVALTAACAVADHEHGRLVVFSVRRRRRVATIPVGAGPHGVWALG